MYTHIPNNVQETYITTSKIQMSDNLSVFTNI